MQRTGRHTNKVSMSAQQRLLLSICVRAYRVALLREVRFVAQLSRTSLITPTIVRVASQRMLLRYQKRWD